MLVTGLGDAHLDPGLQINLVGGIGALHLRRIGKGHAFTPGIDALPGHEVQTQNHILGGHDNRLAGRGRQDIVGGHHQRPGLELGFQGQRYVHRHLVTIEVGVVGSTDQRV